MKKRRILLLEVFLLTFLFGMNTIGAEDQKYKLYLDISFRENLIFDKYDVDLYVDDQEIGTLEYASAFTKLVDVSGKNHKITFYKSSNHDYKGEEEIEIANDSTYQATIQTDAKKINIISSEIKEGIEGSSIEVSDVRLMLLPTAIEILKDKGLDNIIYEGADGGKIKKESNWIVLAQNIAPGNAIDKNEEIKLSCQKIVEYLEETFVDKTVPEVIELANSVAYEISFIDSLTDRDMRNVFLETSMEELNQWKVQEAIAVDSNQKVVKLIVSFGGKTIVPHVEGMSLTNAINELHIARIGKIQSLSMEDKSIKEADGDKWKVISQSEDSGDEVNADKEIILYCESYMELKAISMFDIASRELRNDVSQEETEAETETEDETGNTEISETETELETETEPETEIGSEIETEAVPETETETESPKETETEKEESSSEKERDILFSLMGVDDTSEDEADADNNSETGTSKEKTTYIVISKVNIRSKPSTDGEILGNFNANDQVAVYEIENGWAQIDYNGIIAFVSAKYIQKK